MKSNRREDAVVLVAEDNIDAREIYVLALKEAGYRVVEANDGEEALALFPHQLIDVVLTDLRMPRMDGLALAKAIRSGDHSAGVPIALITATPITDYRLTQIYFSALLTKPCPLDELVETIDRLCGVA